MSEQDKFLEELGIKPEENPFEKPLEVEVPPAEKPEEDEEKLKNRRERRLHERLERRGEEAHQATEEALKWKKIAESKEVRETAEKPDYIKRIERIYGTNSPEAKEATELLAESLKAVEENAVKLAEERILGHLEEERSSESRAVKEEEGNLDRMMDEIEDDYGADFSNPDVRIGFLTLLERVSPKDSDGNIIEYADPDTTWEMFERTRERSANRAKELADRSMTRSGSSQGSKLETDSAERFLKENGII